MCEVSENYRKLCENLSCATGGRGLSLDSHIKHQAQRLTSLVQGKKTLQELYLRHKSLSRGMTLAQVPAMKSYQMDSKSEHDGDFYGDYSCGFQESMHFSHCLSCHGSCSSGIQLKMATEVDSGYSFRKAVVLVVAIERLKKGLESHEGFRDTDLLDLLNDIFVQEEIPYENTEIDFASPSKFKWLKSSECKIRDSHNKSLAVQQLFRSSKLVAVFLQGLNIKREEKICMSFYAKQNLNGHKLPVTLGLVGKDLYLSCTLVDSQPELHLETVKNIKQVKNEDLLRFIFMKSAYGSRFSFESAACPGWYISTPQADNELVRVMPEADQRSVRDFTVVS
uniref:Interleukin-1 n=1 Tax=Leptobrachium leishanense TaxID=445787 RepID=A0A8C5M3E0_9ANUR